MTEPEQANDALPVDFRKDGTVTFSLDGQRIRLRRPKIREHQNLLELLDAANEEITDYAEDQRYHAGELADVEDPLALRNRTRDDLTDELRELEALRVENDGEVSERAEALQAALDAGRLSQDERAELRRVQKEARALTRSLRDKQREVRLRWVLVVLETLAQQRPKVLDADDPAGELESWTGTARFVQELGAHWLSVPLRRG